MLSVLTRSFALMIALLIPAGTSAFTISQMSMQLSPSGGTSTLLVKNPTNAPINMSLRVFAWTDSRDLSSLEKTQDLIAVPPIFAIAPNSEQTVRVALRKPLAVEQEATYRVVLSQIPSEVGDQQGVSLNFTVNLPIFVKPQDARPLPAWAITQQQGDDAKLVLTNSGDSHIKLASLVLESINGQSLTTLPGQGQYIFGGEQRGWPLDAEILKAKQAITVKADTNIGLLESVVSLPES